MGVLLLALGLLPSTAAAPAGCQAELDKWCNLPSSCPHPPPAGCGKGQRFFALYSRGDPERHSEAKPYWRCFAGASLNANRTRYLGSSPGCYCTREADLHRIYTSKCQVHPPPAPLGPPWPSRRPRAPFRLWAFPYPYSYNASQLYRGANVFAGCCHGTSVQQDAAVIAASRHNVSVLQWAYGPDSPTSGANESAKVQYYADTATPTTQLLQGRNFTAAGVSLDEYVGKTPNYKGMADRVVAAQGWRQAKARHPYAFRAIFVDDADDIFVGLMTDGTLDLAIVEGYSVCPGCPHCGCLSNYTGYFGRLDYARAHGYINRTIFLFGWVVARQPRAPHGWTLPQLTSAVRHVKALYPELPGVGFYGSAWPANDTATPQLVKAANALALELFPDAPAQAVGLMERTPSVAQPAWVDVHARTNPYASAVPVSELVRWGNGLNDFFSPVGTGEGGNISVQVDQHGVAKAFRFRLDNHQAGLKQRAELMNCWVTNATLEASGLDPGGELVKDMGQLYMLGDNECPGAPTSLVPSGAWTEDVEMRVSYDMLIPPGGMSPNAQAILGQFHGREDPRIFLLPNQTILRLSTPVAAKLCANASRRYGNCVGGQLIGPDGQPTGWHYQWGGFPPLVFGFDPVSRWFYVEGRSDDRAFKMTHTAADCHFHWPADWPNKRRCADAPHETVLGLWRRPFSQWKFEWVRFEWRVRWSSFSDDAQGSHKNGSVVLLMDSEKVVDYTGPIGRNDGGRLPYFKIGMYNPSGLVAGATEVQFRNYSQSWG